MNARSKLCWWVVAGLILLGGAVGAEDDATTAPPVVEELLAASIQELGAGIGLRFETERQPTYDVFVLETPYRLVIDLIGVQAPVKPQAPVTMPHVRDLRYSLWRDSATEPIVRYVLECDALPTYTVRSDAGALVVEVAWPGGVETDTDGAREVTPPAAAQPPAPIPAWPNEQAWLLDFSAPVPGEEPAEEPAEESAEEPAEESVPEQETAQAASPPAAAQEEAESDAVDQDGGFGPLMVPLSELSASATATEPRDPASETTPSLSELIRRADELEPFQTPPGSAGAAPDGDASCPEVWGEAVMLTATDPRPAEDVPAESESPPQAISAPEELVAAADSDADYVEAAADMASDGIAETREPVAEPRDPRWTDQSGNEIPDRFEAVIAERLPAATERAQGDWSEQVLSQDPAPLLGDTDAEFSLGGPGQHPPMSLDVQGADVRTVLRSIAEYAGTNIVADKDVSGNVSIRALDLPWPDMLQTVCRSMGLIAIDHGAVIRVATARTAQDEAVARESAARKQEEYLPLETRIVPLRFAQAEELKEVVSAMRGNRGKVEVDPRTNALILTDITPRLDLLEQTLQDLDEQTMQVEITAEIVDIDVTDARQLGINWGVENYHSTSANASGRAAIASPDVLDPAFEAQVGVLRSFGEVQARIQALVTANKADIISTPRITTVNNRMARILVGKEVPLITMDEAGNAITELKKVGITLEVTPYVNSEEQITLDLHPEVSDLSSQSTVQGGVVFTTTEADTRVMVRTGETAVIGGLIRTLEGQLERGVPIIKDVPLLGQFFKHTDSREEKRELLIFVTPRLVKAGIDSGD